MPTVRFNVIVRDVCGGGEITRFDQVTKEDLDRWAAARCIYHENEIIPLYNAYVQPIC